MASRLLIPLGLCIFLHSCGTTDDGGMTAAESDCKDLADFSISAESIAIPTAGVAINTAFRFTPTAAYCEVVGEIFPVDPTAPAISFQINLPSSWNGKGLQFAGTGIYGGELITGTGYMGAVSGNTRNPTPLAQKYATWGSDSGHQSPDGSFMLNDEALINFGGDHLKKTNDVAVSIINTFYGSAPEKIYIQGDKQGGRAALIAAQRWPADYDGVIAINPLTTMVGQHLAAIKAEQALAQPNASLSDTQAAIVSSSVVNTCDSLDGTADGIVHNINACEAAYNIDNLRCGSLILDQETCLADAQIGALNSISEAVATPLLIDDVREVAGWPIEAVDFSMLLNTTVPLFSPSTTAAPLIRYGILRNRLANHTSFTTTGNETRITELSKLLDTSSEIGEFVNGGGKILLLHETSSDASVYGNTVNWLERAIASSGIQSPANSVNLKLVSEIKSEELFGYLSALDRWSVAGTVPTNLVSNSVQ